jgi:TetR/AcrR family transcriptional regulator, cholesterol catabolism regulator
VPGADRKRAIRPDAGSGKPGEDAGKDGRAPRAQRSRAGRPARAVLSGRNAVPRTRRPRTEQNLEMLLAGAAALMARRGYDKTSIRDVARETGFSLAGMYYYCRGKEELLHKIQVQTFATLLREQEDLAARSAKAEERLRGLIRNHLSYLTGHANELKVCTFELESLKGSHYREVERLRKGYYGLVASIIGELMGCCPEAARDSAEVRHNTLFVFGMLNWVFMWFDPKRDQPIDDLTRQMCELTLNGVRGTRRARRPAVKPR